MATSTPPAECVFDLLASLLQVAHHLIGAALSLKTPVAGDLASAPLDPAAQHLNLVPELVREAHNSLPTSSSANIPRSEPRQSCEELPPTRARPARCRIDARVMQDLPQPWRRRSDDRAGPVHLHAPVSPGGVLSCPAYHQVLDRCCSRGTSGRAAGGVVPFP